LGDVSWSPRSDWIAVGWGGRFRTLERIRIADGAEFSLGQG
jgi:hypothetical protein